jgi:acetyl esterase/lipase
MPTSEIRYGTAPAQAIDLFLPRGRGPHPVAILIHGGCWSRETAGREQLRHLGGALAERGIAVWSIGYRRANEAGGGCRGRRCSRSSSTSSSAQHCCGFS